MSVRSRRQKAFGLFIVVLAVALIAGAAGFATGYGTDASKRMALAEENRFLRAENEELSGIKIDSEKTVALGTENEALKAEIEELKKKNEELSVKLSDAEDELSGAKDALAESENARKEAENRSTGNVQEPTAADEDPEAGFMDKITNWFIIGIIGILVIMGAALIFAPKARKEDAEDESEDSVADHVSEEDDEEEQYVAFEETEDDGEEVSEAEPETVISGDGQTEMVFEESDEKENATSADVPNSLEELMLESIKRDKE